MNPYTVHIEELEHRIATMILYTHMKLNDSDWHAVADAAIDIRELEAELRVYKSLTPTGGGGTITNTSTDRGDPDG